MLSKNIIEKWIIPHLSVGIRGFEPTVPLVELVEAIFHRLKTGCQWRELPTKQFFSGTILIGSPMRLEYSILSFSKME